MSAKRKSTSQATPSARRKVDDNEAASLAQKLQANQCKNSLKFINEFLEKNPAKASQVENLIRNGILDDAPPSLDEDREYLAPSQNKFNLLPIEVMRDILKSFGEDTISEKDLKDIRAKKILMQWICMALHVDPSSALYSKSIPKLLQMCSDRYKSMGHRMKNITGPLSIGTKKEGCFKLLKNDAGDFDRVQHIGGGIVSLQHHLPGTEDVAIQNNFNDNKARIVGDVDEINLHKLFLKAGQALEVPLCLEQCPASQRCASPALSSRSGLSSSGASGVALAGRMELPAPALAAPAGWGGAVQE
jgi:hypothetical protein